MKQSFVRNWQVISGVPEYGFIFNGVENLTKRYETDDLTNFHELSELFFNSRLKTLFSDSELANLRKIFVFILLFARYFVFVGRTKERFREKYAPECCLKNLKNERNTEKKTHFFFFRFTITFK